MEPATTTQAVGSILTPLFESGTGTFKYLKRKYGYLKHMNRNFQELENEERSLCDKEKTVSEDLQNNRIKMKISSECESWFSKARKMQDDIQKLKKDYRQIGGCFCRKHSISSQLKLGKRMVEMKNKVISLKNEICEIRIMVQKPPDPYLRRHAENVEEIPSLSEYVEKLDEYLRDVSFKRICIWGPLGVGKTTIMENVHDAIGESGEFNIVFWINVNRVQNIRDMQEILLKRLNLNAEELINEERANIISEELENKSFVLFLDEVSSDINLREMGIHDQHRHGNVVFACRSRESYLRADVVIQVQRLSDGDAQKLFWKIVGVHLKNKSDIKRVANLIIKECGGMPCMLKLIGNDLANESEAEIWRAMWKLLTSPTGELKQELEEVYKAFKLVYDKLPSNTQHCILYWALFPVGSELHRDYIIDCWRAEHFFEQYDKLGDARDRGHYILKELVKKSLLGEQRETAHYKMFEYFRRAALRTVDGCVSSGRILVKERDQIREEEWEKAERMSLIGSPLSIPPERPKSRSMLTLLLQKSELKTLPMSFFEYMCCLQLLDLQSTIISLLPPSISSLKNLKTLFLCYCRHLMQLPPEIGDLQKLEIFDMRWSGIRSLPTQIGQLTDLKCLRVSFVGSAGNNNHVNPGLVEMIPSNTISGLHSLEELIVEVQDPTDDICQQNIVSLVGEVAALEELTTLWFHFPTIDCVQTFIDSSKSWKTSDTLQGGNDFRSFRINVGCQQSSSQTESIISGRSAKKHLIFSAGAGIPGEVLTILKQAYSFELIGHQDAANLSVFGANNLGVVETCIVENCNEMTSIIDGNHAEDAVFQSLIKLHIKNLPKLLHIWEGSIASESLNSLTTLTVKECHSIKTLFSNEMILQLNKLQVLQVEDCNEMTSIICSNHTTGVAFQGLNKLLIKNLPNLVHIWEGSIASKSLNNLTTLMVKTCHSIKTLFSKEMVIQLNKLQSMQVEDCSVIEKIIEDRCKVDSKAFPELKNLHLIKCPQLSTIGSNVSLVWPSLQKIKIETCEELRSFPSAFKNATKLKVIQCPQTWLEQLDWQNDTHLKDHFKRLHRSITRTF